MLFHSKSSRRCKINLSKKKQKHNIANSHTDAHSFAQMPSVTLFQMTTSINYEGSVIT